MATALHAIYTELKRLQQEGVDRLFIDDTSLRLLEKAANSSLNQPQKNSVSASTKAVFESLIQSTSKGATAHAAETPAKASSDTRPETCTIKFPTPPELEIPPGTIESKLTWLNNQIENCPTCNSQRNPNAKLVFGTGSPNAKIFFCGEAPGSYEETTGEPFVGKAGQLLSKIISAMGLKRESVYLSNILKWRPQHDKPYGNRPPTQAEMNFCLPYLKAQINIIQPQVIVALGNTTVTGLLGPESNGKWGQIRGQWHEFAGIPLMATFHPSYLIRNDTLKTKRMAWEDMLKVMKKVEMDISAKQQGYFLPKN